MLFPDRSPILLMQGRVSRERGWGHPSVAKPHHLLICIEAGECDFTIGEDSIKLKQGELLLLIQGEHYSAQTERGFRHTFYYFLLGGAGENKPLPLPRISRADGEVGLFLSRASTEPPGSVNADLAFLSALARISESMVSASEGSLIAEIKRYLGEHLASPVSLGALADRFGYTRQHLVKLFRLQAGVTPMAYLASLRLERAAVMLCEREITVREVAESCGFADANYFARAFRRRYGLSPSEHRHRNGL